MSRDTFKYKGYEGTIEASIEDDCLMGEVLFINDLIVYEGNTVSELEANFKIALDSYLEDCEEEGIEPNKPFSGSFNIRVGDDLHKAAALFAHRNECSINDVIKRALNYYLKEKREIHVHHHKHEVANVTQESRNFGTYRKSEPTLRLVR